MLHPAGACRRCYRVCCGEIVLPNLTSSSDSSIAPAVCGLHALQQLSLHRETFATVAPQCVNKCLCAAMILTVQMHLHGSDIRLQQLLGKCICNGLACCFVCLVVLLCQCACMWQEACKSCMERCAPRIVTSHRARPIAACACVKHVLCSVTAGAPRVGSWTCKVICNTSPATWGKLQRLRQHSSAPAGKSLEDSSHTDAAVSGAAPRCCRSTG